MRARTPYTPDQVIPGGLADAVDELPYWFVIGGQAVRCLCPYRPTHDVDFGVRRPRDLRELLAQLARSGTTEIVERAPDTVHLRWNGIDVSVFVLERFAPHVTERRLTVTGILATKLHAILDRGTRRDFFDLYVVLQRERLGAVECLRALREVYRQDVNEGLLLRALTYFEDAEREPKLPGEGARDWKLVTAYFMATAGALVVPPTAALRIQARVVDVRERTKPARRPRATRRR
ncbi:MAG: nucleotidyl transferase AbiEii/AbiGii toxin family protein [Kofleriaceae bacterium]